MNLTPRATAALLGIAVTAATPAAATAAAANAAATKTYAGSTYAMRWGPVTVRITVSGKRIVDVRASLPTERARSAQINGHAGPILRREALQSAGKSVHAVSGATMTSSAYALSLRSALRKAHI
jgi:uncharacterized protein with FMN-binding domain